MQQREDWQDYGIRWELELKEDPAQVWGQVLSYLVQIDWLVFMVGVLLGHVDFRATTRDEEDESRYRAPLLDWWPLLTDGFRKGRLIVEKEALHLAAPPSPRCEGNVEQAPSAASNRSPTAPSSR